MFAMSITAKELAKKLELSETAVSMALNNKSGVSTSGIAEATRSSVIHQSLMKFWMELKKNAAARAIR